MKKVTIFLAGAFAALDVAAQTPISIVVEPDVSLSVRRFASDIRAEQRQLMLVLPNDTAFAFMAIGTRVMPMLEAPISPGIRDEALHRINTLRFTETSTDVSNGVDRARLWLEGMPGRHILVLLTDGEQRTPPGNPNAKHSFQSLLDQAVTEDPRIEIYVRLFGRASLNPRSTHVHVLREAPDWRTLLGVVPAKPVVNISLKTEPVFWTWDIAGIIALAVSGLLAATGLALRRRRIRRMEIEAITGSVEREPDSRPESLMKTAIRFAVRPERELGRVEYLEPMTNPELMVGDSPLAQLYIATSGACFRLIARDNRLEIQNCGDTVIHIGKRKIPSGSAVIVPACYLETQLGDELVSITPEQFSRDLTTGLTQGAKTK